MRTTTLALILTVCGLSGCTGSTQEQSEAVATGPQNSLLYAVAWKQTAAEYRALYYQGFNLAKMHVEAAIANRNPTGKPLAVISDLDDTLLLTLDYWGHLVSQDRDFFDDAIWDRWIPDNTVTASPGATEFLRFCADNGIEVFYVTNRDQGEATYQNAMAHLVSLEFPYADEDHLFVLRETSNKQAVQEGIMEDYDAIVLLGDNLNDFSRKYYSTDVDERRELMEQDRKAFGRRNIIFPNPTNGHWLRAIFGDSEPPPSAQNRQTLKEAAMRSRWNP